MRVPGCCAPPRRRHTRRRASIDSRAAVSAPLILTLTLRPEDAARFDRLRQAHFPPGRNLVPAHLTLFHHLPGEEARSIEDTLHLACRHQPPQEVQVTGLRSLGRGVAYVVQAPGIAALRATLAREWHDALTAQDRQAWRAHITIQNKAPPADARALLDVMQAAFAPFGVWAEGLSLWRYLGGPWEAAGRYAFSGAPLAPPP